MNFISFNPKSYTFWRRISQFSFILLLILIPMLGVFRIDVANTSFVVFGKHYWWNEIALTLAGIIMLAVTYAGISIVYGRIFCGWACPQNLMGEISDWFEYRIFGQSTIHDTKVLYRHEPYKGLARVNVVLMLVIFLLAMGIFVWLVAGSYFVPFSQMVQFLLHPNLIVLGTVIMVTGMMTVYFFMGHWWCKLACPVGMLPFLLWNPRTMTLRYDELRKDECEKCNACFTACMMQINVKDAGDAKRWCLNCGLCSDVCAERLSVKGKPGLFTIEAGKGKLPGSVYIVSAAFAGAALIFGYGLSIHKDLEVSLVAKNLQGQTLSRGIQGEMIANFQVKVSNKDARAHDLRLKVEGLPEGSYSLSETRELWRAGEIRRIQLTVRVKGTEFKPLSTKTFVVSVAEPSNPKFSAQGRGQLFIPSP